MAILNNPDTSTRAAELRLGLAWSHCDETNRTAAAQADVSALRDIHASLNWHEKLIFAAILNLRGEGLIHVDGDQAHSRPAGPHQSVGVDRADAGRIALGECILETISDPA
ncbi:hypothetical protein AB5I41_28930 [Sphingomonas sp. MMS24-JH45]